MRLLQLLAWLPDVLDRIRCCCPGCAVCLVDDARKTSCLARWADHGAAVYRCFLRCAAVFGNAAADDLCAAAGLWLVALDAWWYREKAASGQHFAGTAGGS